MRSIKEAQEQLARPDGQPMRLDRFAVQFGMSYASFRRLFKQQTGYSPRQYALIASVRRAEHLLQTDKSLRLIAKELGFSSVSYFSRFIKKKTGINPTELRQTRRFSARSDLSAVKLEIGKTGV